MVETGIVETGVAATTATRTDFDEFVLAGSPLLLRTAYLLTHDHALAEDLAQTALTQAWLAWSRLERPDAYVRKVLVNTHVSWRRRKWNGEQAHADVPEAASAPDDADDRQDLWAALSRLPRRQRAVVVLRFVEDLTEEETARLLGVTTGTVKSQASKALARLRVDPALTSGRSGSGQPRVRRGPAGRRP